MIHNLFCKRKFIFSDFTGACYRRLKQFLSGYIILLCLIFGLTHQCLAQSSIYFYPGNNPGFGDPNNYAASMPVIASNWLYLYTYTQGKTNYCLWRTDPDGLPSEPNNLASFDPNSVWTAVDITGIYDQVSDPNIQFIALCSYKNCLYIAGQSNQKPYLWRPEDADLDPNDIEWDSVAPNDLTSGTINALHEFNDHLYMGVTAPGATENNEVALWYSIEPDSQKITSDDWDSITCDQIISNKNTEISYLQKYETRLYLGTKNTENGCEIWSLDKNSKTPQNLTKDGLGTLGTPRTKNKEITAMAVAGDVLYAVTWNADGSQLWYYKENESKFSETPSGMWQQDPNQINPLSLESLGSYLFLGFDTDTIQRLTYWDPNGDSEQVTALNDANHPPYDANQPILADDTHLCWMYADKTNGHLYLGTKRTKESNTTNTNGFTLWKSSLLPIITITSPKPPLNAFHDGNLPIKWETTKGGYYQINLIEFKTPNEFKDPNINKYFPLCIYPNPNAPPATSLNKICITSSVLELGGKEALEGRYTMEISWDLDPNRNPITKDKETYPVRFSFKYDTTDPSIPTLIDVSAGNEKLRIRWTESIDIFSGVMGYNIHWEPIEDPNIEAFSGPYNPVYVGESDYTINQANGQQYLEYTISQLVNYLNYRIAVSAIDYANNESAKSLEFFGTPEPGRGLMDLLGETGGCFLNALHHNNKIRLYNENVRFSL